MRRDRPRSRLGGAGVCALALAICVLLAGTAAAATSSSSSAATSGSSSAATATAPNTPVLVSSQNPPPPGYRLSAARVERIAAASLTARQELRRHPNAIPYEYTKGPGQWQVSWF